MAPVDTSVSGIAGKRRYKFRESVQTDIGKKRKENQDAFAIAHSQDASLYIVADGMGGARGGGTASALAVNVIIQKAILPSGEVTEVSLKRSIELANAVIFSRSSQDEDLSGMGTTVVALAFVGSRAIVAHVGDSRIYRLKEGRIEQLTRDHTLVQELVETGAIPAEDAANHPIAHMLTRSLGPTDAVDVEIRELDADVQPGEKFLLCSDGLYNMVSDEEIAEILGEQDLRHAVNELVSLALNRGGTDNVTIEVLELCPLDDDSLEVSYPSGVNVERRLSGEIALARLEEEIEKVVLREESKAAPGVPQAEAPPPLSSAASKASDEAEDLIHDGGEFSQSEDSSAEDQVAEPLDGQSVVPPLGEELDERLGAEVEPTDISLAKEVNLEGDGLDEALVDERSPEKEALISYDASLDRANSELNKLAKIAAVVMGIGLVVGAYLFGKSMKVPQTLQIASTKPSQTSPAEVLPGESEAEREELLDELALSVDETMVQEEETEASDAPPTEGTEGITEGIKDGESLEMAPNGAVDTTHSEGASVEKQPEIASSGEPEELAMVKEKADSLKIPPPPRVLISGAQKPKTDSLQPISWESEAKKVDKIQQAQTTNDSVKKSTGSPETTLLSEGEIREIIARKQEIRIKIADLDAKTEILALETKEQSQEKRKLVQDELEKNATALASTSEQLAGVERRVSRWLEIKGGSTGKQNIKLADEVSELDEMVLKKKQSFSRASVRYLESVDAWQQQPNDMALASEMGRLARVLQQKRQELEESINIAIASGINDSLAELGSLSASKDNLMRRKDHLNRHIGYLEGFTPFSASRKLELRDSYLAERQSLTKELESLKAKVSDEQELESVRLSRISVYAKPNRE